MLNPVLFFRTPTRRAGRRPRPLAPGPLLAALLTAGAAALPLPALAAPPDVADSIAALPRSVELVLVIDHAAADRELPGARAAQQALADLGLFAEVAPKWKALADGLGWSQQETFDRLLGGRVVLVMRDIQDEASRRWALLSEVSADTDQRLKSRLAVAPRKIADSHAILAVECGAYELASHSAPPSSPHDPDRPVTLIFGPAGKSEMFDELLAVLSRGGQKTLAPTPAVAAARAAGRSSLTLLIRIDSSRDSSPAEPALNPPHTEPVGDWEDFLLFTASPSNNGWKSRAVLRDHELAPDLAKVRPQPDSCLGEIGEGAFLAVVEHPLANSGNGSESPWVRSLNLIKMPPEVAVLLSGRQALAIGTSPADRNLPVPLLATDKKTPAAPPQLWLRLAMETSDAAALAPAADKYIAQIIHGLEASLGAKPGAGADFGGAACGAVRTLPIDIPDPPPQQSPFRGRMMLAWSFPCEDAAQGAAPRPGWWIVSLSPEHLGAPGVAIIAKFPGAGPDSPDTAQVMRRLSTCLLQPRPDEHAKPWLSIGFFHPDQGADLLAQFLPGKGLAKTLKRFSNVSWRFCVSDAHGIEGAIDLELTPAAP